MEAGRKEMAHVARTVPHEVAERPHLLSLHLPKNIEEKDVETMRELFASALRAAHAFATKPGELLRILGRSGAQERKALRGSEAHVIRSILGVIEEEAGKKILFPIPWRYQVLLAISELAKRNLEANPGYRQIVEKYKKRAKPT